MSVSIKTVSLLLAVGVALGCLSCDRRGASTTDSAADGGAAGEAPGAGLPQCYPPDDQELGTFLYDPHNRLVIESGCAPVGFSGMGVVSRIQQSASSTGGVRLISVLLDAPGECESGASAPAQINILNSYEDWGLQVGSQLRVDLIGNRRSGFGAGGGGAVVRHPDGQLLVAFLDKEGEDHVTAFLARLPIAAGFASECLEVGAPGTCGGPAIRKSLSLPAGGLLQERQATMISIAGAEFHLGLSTARDWLACSDCSPCLDGAPLGPNYRLLLLRLPDP